MGPTWAHLGPTGPRWASCWPHEPCYLGYHTSQNLRWRYFQMRSWRFNRRKQFAIWNLQNFEKGLKDILFCLSVDLHCPPKFSGYHKINSFVVKIISANTNRARSPVVGLLRRPAAPTQGPESSTAGQEAPAGGDEGSDGEAKSQRFIRELISTSSAPIWKITARYYYNTMNSPQNKHNSHP